MNEKQIDEVMELVEDWSMKDFLAADARLDPWSEHDPASPMCLQEKLDAEANSAKEAIRAKLIELAGWQPIETAPKDQWVFVVYPDREVSKAIFNVGVWMDWDGDLYGTPTHWQPLLEAPQ